MRRALRLTATGLVVAVALALVIGVIVTVAKRNGTGPHHAGPTATPAAHHTSSNPASRPSSPATPAAGGNQAELVAALSRYVSMYFTVPRGTTEQQWVARVKAATPAAAWAQMAPTITGLPAGWSATAVPLTKQVNVQHPHTAGQLYVILPVDVTLTDPHGKTYAPAKYLTDSVWQLQGGRWIMLHFSNVQPGGGQS